MSGKSDDAEVGKALELKGLAQWRASGGERLVAHTYQSTQAHSHTLGKHWPVRQGGFGCAVADMKESLGRLT